VVGLTLAVRSERRELRRATNRTQELQQVSDELLRANRAKNEFLANVSHELRTPLNAIVGFTELLREGVYGELTGRQAPPVERIEASANHLRGLVDQILDLAKIAAGRLDVHQERIDLRSFVLDVVTEVEPLVHEKGLTLSIGVGATLPKLRTDPSHLRAILLNLLGNAIKFTERGTIGVRARMATGNLPSSDRLRLSPAMGADLEKIRAAAEAEPLSWIAVQVVDSGVGIAPRDRDRIFDEFEQVGSAGRGDSMRRGTGLGLTISRRLARLLGGDLTVESEVGTGSTFTIWLPIEKTTS
jgi:signal transduction histidine kinase